MPQVFDMFGLRARRREFSGFAQWGGAARSGKVQRPKGFPDGPVGGDPDNPLIHQTGSLDVRSYEEPPISGVEAAIDLVSEVPGWLCIKRQDLAAWNSHEAVYGFKVRIATSGAPSTAVWVGSSAVAACYGLP